MYSVASMALYLVFFSCLATIVMATWEIFDMVIEFPIFKRTREDYLEILLLFFIFNICLRRHKLT